MNNRLTLSIAMCTYNGERYLREQLHSFLQQELFPSELIACDDGSKDNTLGILEDFASSAPFPVKIYANPQNLGFSKNFEKAMGCCQGEIIAFSDQDDVWLPAKLVNIEQLFRTQPDTGLVFSDASMVDEDLRPLGYSLWEAKGFITQFQKKISTSQWLEVFLRDLLPLGSTMAVRSNILEHVLPVPQYWSHDDWLPLAVGFYAKIVCTPEIYILYRQHRSQYIGVKKRNLLNRYLASKAMDRNKYIYLAQKWQIAISCLFNDNNVANNKSLQKIKDKIYHHMMRGTLPSSFLKRLPFVLREAATGNYHKYSSGFSSIIKDIF